MLVGVRLTSFKTAVADQPPSLTLFCLYGYMQCDMRELQFLRTGLGRGLKSLNDPVALYSLSGVNPKYFLSLFLKGEKPQYKYWSCKIILKVGFLFYRPGGHFPSTLSAQRTFFNKNSKYENSINLFEINPFERHQLERHQKPSKAIKSRQKVLEAIKSHQKPSKEVKRH